MKFLEYINESKVIIFHGSNTKVTKLESKYMNIGNVQEGIGIYFGDLETAEAYGSNIITVEIEHNDFVDSRKSWNEELKTSDLTKILIHLWKTDEEIMYYMLTDWVEIMEVEDIEEYHISDMAENMSSGQIRNIQIELAEQFGVEAFVKIWMKVLPKIKGTYQKQSRDTWYAIINTKIKVKKYK